MRMKEKYMKITAVERRMDTQDFMMENMKFENVKKMRLMQQVFMLMRGKLNI